MFIFRDFSLERKQMIKKTEIGSLTSIVLLPSIIGVAGNLNNVLRIYKILYEQNWCGRREDDDRNSLDAK